MIIVTGAPSLEIPKDINTIEWTERRLPALLNLVRKYKKGRGAPILIDNTYIDKALAERLLKKYFSRVHDKYFPRHAKKRRLRRLFKLSLPLRNNYDFIIHITPDKRSQAVPAGEYTLLTRLDIRKLPYRERLNRVREHILEATGSILTRFHRRREAKVRSRAVRILLNIWSYRLFDKPYRNLSEDERKRVLYVAKIDINERPHFRNDALARARRDLMKFYPRRVVWLRYIYNLAKRPEIDLRDLYTNIKELLARRYKIPKRIRNALEDLLLEIKEYRGDPYRFLVDNIEHTLGSRMGFFVYRSGKYSLVVRPWPSRAPRSTIRDMMRVLLALGVTNIKIYLRSKRERVADRLKLYRSSPYARWPEVLGDTVAPRDDYEAVLRIEVNTALKHILDDTHRYLLALVLLLTLNLIAGFGPRTIQVINDLLRHVLIRFEAFLVRLYRVDSLAELLLRSYRLSKYWLPFDEFSTLDPP